MDILGRDFSPRVVKPQEEEKKFPHESRKAHDIWRSRSGEDKFPHERRSREWANLFSPRLLCHEWGRYCALSDEWGNLTVPISPH